MSAGKFIMLLGGTACYDELGLTQLKHMHRNSSKRIQNGVGQLTIVEHALCPIDSRMSLTESYNHQTSFNYSTGTRNRRTGRVRVFCPLGLSPQDELVLWGMLAITLADADSDGELHVTRHFLLRQLGLINAQSRRGGRQYHQITKAIERIAAVQYFNDSFYDPIRSEHRNINFGFFSYSLPTDLSSSRAWRIIWDPMFFQFAKAARGALRFDLETYRKLDAASRRLYLFASKLLSGKDVTHPIHVGDLVTSVMGYDPDLRPFEQNARLRRCLRRLIQYGVLREGDTKLYKRSKNRYSVVMAKGILLRQPHTNVKHTESPLFEPLCEIGFDARGAQWLLSEYATHLVREWVDITLAAKERFGMQFFNRSPAAFLRYYLQRAAAGKDGPPDWWHDIRKAEENARAERARKRRSTQVPDQLPKKAMDSLDSVRDDIFHQFLAAGQSEKQATENARRFKAALRPKR